MPRRIKIPGMLDPHVHLRGMDWSHKGTFASETAAALAGGYTAVLDMPNTSPSTIDGQTLTFKLNEIRQEALCDWGVYFGASQADNTTEFARVFDRVCGLKIYCNATTGDLLIEYQALREKIYRAWPAGKVIAVHAEGETILEILALVRQTRKFTHFCHVSSAEEIRYLTAAKEQGLPISIGVCPHHLYLSQDDLPALGPFGLMKPELKTKRDQAALWDAIQRGIVDIIESDHAPHTLPEKQSDDPPYGVPGLETALPLMLLAVEEGRVTLERVIEMVATHPRRIFNVPCEDETYTLVNLDEEWVIENDLLWTQAKWSPFAGMQIVGRVEEVAIRGQCVFDFNTQATTARHSRNLFGGEQ